jgi:N6-adenosine-specific RNA methylase IME4
MNKYSVIYADPAWKFKTYSEKGLGRSPEAYYDCMSIDEIKQLPVADYAADDCVLLMWVTDPFLQKSFEVIESWGFVYKTVGFYWVKGNWLVGDLKHCASDFSMGTGYWTRANPEQCLLAKRGNPKRINVDVRKLIISPRREHSRKPDEVYERIERLCAGPYIELFARQRREGWDTAFSNEVDTGPSARRWDSRKHEYETPKVRGFFNLEDKQP